MDIRKIKLDAQEYPHKITVCMSLPEMLFIAKIVGATTDGTAEEVMQGGAKTSREIWTALSGGVINRFWEDGIEGVKIDKQEKSL
jgi:hypothetical protein